MNQNNSGSRFSQSIPVIKVSTRGQSNNNINSGKTNNSFFSRFNRNQNNNSNTKNKNDNRTNLRGKKIVPIDHQNYFSSTQKLGPSRQSWQNLSAAVHDLASKCFVSLTNPQLLTEFLHAESQLADFFRLSKMVFNNARPTRGNPRKMSQASHQPRPPTFNPPARSSSARRKIRNNDSNNNNNNNNNDNNQNSNTDTQNQENANDQISTEKNDTEITQNNGGNKNVGSDLRPTHAVSKLGLQFIEQWDSFLGEFNRVSMDGIIPLNSLISSRIFFISQFMKKTVSSFFVSPQANVPIGSMNRAYSVALSIARKARKLHSRASDFSYGIIHLERSIYNFFMDVVPHPMAYTNTIQNARKDLFIQLTELRQMVYGVSIFETVVDKIRLLMEDVNSKFNDLFSELNLPYRIVASYDDAEESKNETEQKNDQVSQEVEFEEEEEEFEDDADKQIIVDTKVRSMYHPPRPKPSEAILDDFDYRKKEQDKETVEHLDKIRTNIAKIEEALAIGQRMIKKKK
ncbi:hypothetical protein M9Y10_015290 [Tritrichomonas musculus]|uniref:Uncharacterized protein n=1 Tax=Tritrichomonas musculus TaxID=1915356 RepID=A0ABR2L2R2_9EUKA